MFEARQAKDGTGNGRAKRDIAEQKRMGQGKVVQGEAWRGRDSIKQDKVDVGEAVEPGGGRVQAGCDSGGRGGTFNTPCPLLKDGV